MPEIRRCQDGYSIELTIATAPVATARSPHNLSPHDDLGVLETVSCDIEALLSLVPGLVVEEMDLKCPDGQFVGNGEPWKIHLRLSKPGFGVSATVSAVKDFQQLWDETHKEAIEQRRQKAREERQRMFARGARDDPWYWS